ncbi:MAG: hypothetical protein RG740_03035 [Acholeplasmataceae bacterium]|nr:hypothetical protein [Acholeplasmataceae bacterium]
MISIAVSIQTIKVNRQIEQFINRATTSESDTVLFSDGTIEERMYHPIKREYDYETNDIRSVFSHDEDKKFIGQKGDIFVTQESPFPSIFGVHQIMTFYVGGHAALHNGNDQFLEAVGFPGPDESILDIIRDPSDGTHNFSVGVRKSNTNYWMLPNFRNESHKDYPYYGNYYRKQFTVLRVKNIDEGQLDLTLDYANMHYENRSLYNFLFFFDMKNKFYCTDFISRSYRHAINHTEKDETFPKTLNDNGFVTTVNDLILSKDTYISVYVENKDGIRHIYYLADSNE